MFPNQIPMGKPKAFPFLFNNPQLHIKSTLRSNTKCKNLFLIRDCLVSISTPVLQPQDVFEQPHALGQKKIEFHISAEVSTILEGPEQDREPLSTDATEGSVFSAPRRSFHPVIHLSTHPPA